MEQQIMANSEKRIAEVSASVQANQDYVIRMLLDNVLDIRPQLHVNYRPDLKK